MHAYVLLQDPSGGLHELVPGDIIGRMWSAALQLDDGRISEAHAMVSLREGQLRLVALRGALALDGKPLAQAPLAPGVRVTLAPGVALDVVEVHLPPHVLGAEAPGLPRQMLPGVCSVLPGPQLVRGWRQDALLHVWFTGDRWMAGARGAAPAPVDVGMELDAGGVPLRLLAIPVRDAGPEVTRRRGDLDTPLRIVANYTTVHVLREGAPPVVFCGMQAQLVSEIVATEGPLSWGALSESLWPREPDAVVRRGRLDTMLSRIRRRLRAAGIRADLVRTDGAGMVEVLLYPNDVVENRT